MTRVSTRRAVLAVLSGTLLPFGALALAERGRYVQALILAGLLALHALLEVALFHRRDRSARVRLQTAERADAGPLLDRVVGW